MPVVFEPQPPPRNVSNLRLFWIIWCCLWAGFWFVSGLFTIVGFLGCPVALACILIPIGKGPKPRSYFVPEQPAAPAQLAPPQPQRPAPVNDEAYQRWLQGGKP